MEPALQVNENGEDIVAERAEVHRLAATLDELMRALLAKDILSRDELNAIENAVSARTGDVPRLW
jgi:hypothetical protein